jgi:hypothetical protein
LLHLGSITPSSTGGPASNPRDDEVGGGGIIRGALSRSGPSRPSAVNTEAWRGSDAGLKTTDVVGPRYDDIRPDIRSEFLHEFAGLAERHNLIVRRIIRRTRPMLEERGLLKRIGVITHPRPADGLPSALFDEQGLVMGLAFTATAAYEAAEQFSSLYAARQPGAGFLKTILLRRIGSSARAGLDTARHLLDRLDGAGIPEDERTDEDNSKDVAPPDLQEIQLSRTVKRNLASVVDRSDIDPKVEVFLHYLRDAGWLETNGSIIFSQYRATAEWIAEALGTAFPNEPVALYAGGSASFVQRGSDRRSAGREQIKAAIERGDIRLVCATDAACEGLNLQRLGAQVNVDLPWNPSRLEQLLWGAAGTRRWSWRYGGWDLSSALHRRLSSAVANERTRFLLRFSTRSAPMFSNSTTLIYAR